MHSSHHSRGRIIFEALCALIMAISLAGAWPQTGAWALLAAAAASLAYVLVRLSDLAGPRPAMAAAPQPDDVPAPVAAVEDAMPAAEAPVAAALPLAGQADGPAAVPRPKKARAPRKGSRTRVGDGKSAGTSAPSLPADAETARSTVQDEMDAMLSVFPEQPDPGRIEPLFDPEPHFRQHRAVFGRKAG